MPVDQYTQHDWSPLLWASLLTGMAVFVIGTICLFVAMVYRASQTTGATRESRDADVHELKKAEHVPPRELSHDSARAS